MRSGRVVLKNPISIFSTSTSISDVYKRHLESYKAGAVLFQCDEKQLRNISKKYEDMLGNYQLVITNVHEPVSYTHLDVYKRQR